jgi:hypothetical protein
MGVIQLQHLYLILGLAQCITQTGQLRVVVLNQIAIQALHGVPHRPLQLMQRITHHKDLLPLAIR